jgi:hypothetical protein
MSRSRRNPPRHGRDAGLAVGGPLAHAVGVGLRIGLDRLGSAAVGIAFAQHRVHGRALDRVIFRAGDAFSASVLGFRVIGHGIALPLQLFRIAAKLRHRGRDVGQLDDIGLGLEAEFPQFGQMV